MFEVGQTVKVMFRGQTVDVVIDVDGGYERDTNAHVIEWHFADPALDASPRTLAEEQAVYNILCDMSENEE